MTNELKCAPLYKVSMRGTVKFVCKQCADHWAYIAENSGIHFTPWEISSMPTKLGECEMCEYRVNAERRHDGAGVSL